MDIEVNHNFSDTINNLRINIEASGYVEGDTSWNARDVCLPCSRLYYFESGHGVLEYNGQVITMKPGNLYLVPFGLTFSYRCDSTYTKLYFHITIPRPDGFDLLSDCKQIISMPISISDIQKMTQNYRSGSIVDMLKIKQEVLMHVTSMLPASTVSSFFSTVYSPIVQSTVDYIQQNLSVQLSSADLAARLFICESTLCKHFKEELGVTVGQYIDDSIFLAVEKILVKSKLSISRISETFGFCDQFYFSRRFRQRYAMSPLQYRKKMAGSI